MHFHTEYSVIMFPVFTVVNLIDQNMLEESIPHSTQYLNANWVVVTDVNKYFPGCFPVSRGQKKKYRVTLLHLIG